MHFLSNEEKEKWIEDYVQRETAMARKRVEDAETATKKEHENLITAEIAGFTTREPETTFGDPMIAIGDSLSDHASSKDEEDGDDADAEDTELGKLSKHDKPGWEVGTISNTV